MQKFVWLFICWKTKDNFIMQYVNPYLKRLLINIGADLHSFQHLVISFVLHNFFYSSNWIDSLVTHVQIWLQSSFKSENPSVNLGRKSKEILESTGVFLNIGLIIILNLLFISDKGIN